MNTTKWIILDILLGAIGGYVQSCSAQAMVNPPPNFHSSQFNFNNSPYNFNNSPYNFNNSPFNFNNSPFNFNAQNGVYDANGNRMGYSTVNPQGTTNFFSDSGSPIGYTPQLFAPLGGTHGSK